MATNNEPLIRLSDALRKLKADPSTSHLPSAALREAVVSGKVPSERANEKKRAWYYVRLSDLKNAAVSSRRKIREKVK
jgi:hypothetical protein